jgi:hypothetical protein
VALALGVDESLVDSSVQFLALYAQAHADIPLFLLPLVTFTSFGALTSSLGLVVESIVQGPTIKPLLDGSIHYAWHENIQTYNSLFNDPSG